MEGDLAHPSLGVALPMWTRNLMRNARMDVEVEFVVE